VGIGHGTSAQKCTDAKQKALMSPIRWWIIILFLIGSGMETKLRIHNIEKSTMDHGDEAGG
jgi:hypothetical protein